MAYSRSIDKKSSGQQVFNFQNTPTNFTVRYRH